MQKIIKGTFKCGHPWTREYARGASKQEERVLRNKFKNDMCPKCERGA